MSLHVRTVAMRTWKSILRISLMLLIVFVMLSAMLLSTEGGRISMVKQGVSFWHLWTGQEIEISGIRSPSLGEWSLGQVKLTGMTAAPLIELYELEINWKWQYAAQNRWWFDIVQLDRLHVQLAQPKKSSGESFANIYALWPKIPAIRIEKLHIRHVTIDRPRYPVFSSELNGQAELNWGALPARFLLALTEQDTGNSYAAQLSADSIDRFRLQGALRANQNTAWSQWLKWSLPEPAEAAWDIRIDYSQKGKLNINLDKWSMPWQSHLLEADGSIEYDIESIKLAFAPLSFTLDDKPAVIEGWIAETESELVVSVDDWALDPFVELAGLDNFTGNLSLDAKWFGGWRRPRLDATLFSAGHWREHPFDLQMISVAELAKLRVESMQVALANSQFNATGAIDWLTDELDFTYKGELHTDPLFREKMPAVLGDLQGGGHVEGTVVGPLAGPTITAKANSSGLWRDDVVKAAVSGKWVPGNLSITDLYVYSPILQTSGQAEYQVTDHNWQTTLKVIEWRSDILERLGLSFPVEFKGSGFGDISITGVGKKYDLSGKINIQGLWQDWPLNAQLDIKSLQSSHIQLDSSLLRLGASSMDAEGTVDWLNKELNLAFDHRDWPLATLPPWLSFWPNILSTLDGSLTGSTKVMGPWTRPAIETDSILYGEWFEEPLTLSLISDPNTNTLWSVEKFEAQWLDGSWQYEGQFEPYRLFIDGDAKIQNIHAARIPFLSREFLGSERHLPEALDVAFRGDIAIKGKITSPTLSGMIGAAGMLENQPIELNANIGYLDSSYVDIDDAQGQWAHGTWQLDGLYDWRLNQVAMNIETQTPNASHLIPWLQLAVKNNPDYNWLENWQGSLNGKLQLDNRTDDWLINGDLTSEGELLGDLYQLNWHGSGRINQALTHMLSGSWGSGKVDADLTSSSESIEGYINVEKVTYQQIGSFYAAVPEAVEGVIDARLSISGQWPLPEFQAEIATSGQINSTVSHPFIAHGDLRGNPERWLLDKAVLEIPSAISLTVEGEGQGVQGELSFEGLLPDTAYWVENSEVGPGEAVFKLDVKGELFRPQLFGEFEWRSENWPMSLSGELATTDGVYSLDSSLYSEEQTRFKANIMTPVASLSSWLESLNEKPFDVDIAINTPLTVLDPFFVDQPDQQLAGDLSGHIEMHGNLLAPKWSGDLDWTRGQYEHALYGTLVDDLSLSLVAKDDVWHIEGAATDGSLGIVTLNGDIQFIENKEQVFAHDISIAFGFGNAQLLNQAQMDAGVSGAIQALGFYHNLEVSGTLNVSPLNIQSDTFLWDGVPQLNIIQPGELSTDTVVTKPAYWPQGQWDVTLIADSRANLYGQGINAELMGSVELTDDLYQPLLSGRFEIVRGTYTGFGKIFELTQGVVQMQNNQLVLDVNGVYEEKGLEVALRITGNQDELNLALSSDPVLGQDELLAKLLFGKLTEELDVIQAFQLASVINRLRTGDSRLDLIAATRDELSLDSLVFDTDTDEEGNLAFNVSAGKYINDFLYLEVEKGVGTEQEIRSSLQYQVTPRTYLELYTQGDFGRFNDNGVELNWSWDY